MMRKCGLLILALVVLLCTIPALATDYYVDNQNGNNGNTGLSAGQAWATISFADDRVSAGDMLYIMEGTGVYNEQLAPGSGSAGNYIAFEAYNSDTPRIHVANGTCVNLQDRDYIRIVGLTIGATVQSGTAPVTGIDLHGANHIEITDCIIAYGNNNTWSRGITDDWAEGSGCTYVTISGCNIHHWGTPGGQEPDLGECVKIHDYSDYIIVKDSTFHSAGHVPLAIFADNSIVKGNTISNTGFNKCAAFWGWAGHRMVIEDNDIYESAQYEGTYANGGVQMGVPQGIFRNNRVRNCIGTGLDMYHQMNYHSTDSRIYNNTFYNNGTGGGGGNSGYAVSISQSIASPYCTGIIWQNNIFYADYRQGVGYRDLAQAGDHTETNNWETADGDPRFTHADNGDFTLQPNSPCIDNNGWLTRADGSGSESTTLFVDDSYYFTDGYGIVTGDEIQLQGQSVTAIITAINYGTNMLTLDTALTWTDDMWLSLAYQGSAPDQGAEEREEALSGIEHTITIRLIIETGDPADPDYSISVIPETATIKQGGSVVYILSIIPISGFNNSVSFLIEGLPPGVSATFIPISIDTNEESRLEIHTTPDVSVGIFDLTIRAMEIVR